MVTKFHGASSPGTVCGRLPALIVIAAALLPVGLLHADTITLKSPAGALPVEGTIEDFNAKELVYKSAVGDREIHEPIESVLRIEAAKEPELTAAEKAYADGKWGDAVTLYRRTVTFSTSDWATYRALVRLIDAAGKNGDFGTQVETFLKLTRLDSVNAPAHEPELKGVKKDELAAALKKTQEEMTAAGLDTRLTLLAFIADLHTANDEPKLAAQALEERKKLELAVAPPDPSKPGAEIGPHSVVFRNGDHALKIVFLCDASGSMLNKMAPLKTELQKAVGGLKPIQSFNIIFLQDEKCVALDKSALVVADAANKRRAYKFLDDVTTSGTTDPMPGVTLAFQQHPQVLYFLTDGDFPDNKAVKDTIAKLNADHKVKINTIAFVNDQDTDTDFLELLKEIAKDSGGTYKHVAENELSQ